MGKCGFFFFLSNRKNDYRFWTQFYNGHVLKERERERERECVLSLEKKSHNQSNSLSKKRRRIGHSVLLKRTMLLNLAHYYGNSWQTCTHIRGRSTFFKQSVISALQGAFHCYGCADFAYGASQKTTSEPSEMFIYASIWLFRRVQLALHEHTFLC